VNESSKKKERKKSRTKQEIRLAMPIERTRKIEEEEEEKKRR
jgi:hypothetical protein